MRLEDVNLAAANLVRFALHEMEFENADLSEATLGGVHKGGSITGNVVLPDEYSLVNGLFLGRTFPFGQHIWTPKRSSPQI